MNKHQHQHQNQNLDQHQQYYYTTRFSYDPKRTIVWQEICSYLNKHYIATDSKVLEIGCGYGDFIGNIVAKKKDAIEIEPYFKKFIEKDSQVKIHVTDASIALSEFPENSFDVVFCSNYFEHLEIEPIKDQLKYISKILTKNGRLIVIQPNFQLCCKNYFDDYTHKTIFSHTSFSDLLQLHNFSIYKCYKGFIPFSMKSKFPIIRMFVRFYLKSMIKPAAKQFMIVASVNK
ncbi:MAG: class I SAM-dependent methyltransferase [Oligoflexia bacterium]|nr:class I SAM-dependent methyltransferase [Oligoflexia bacterium]